MTNGMKHNLPPDFSPSEFDFVIGRGRAIKSAKGNVHMYNQIRHIANEYTSSDKARKSILLGELVRKVYERSPQAGFIKRDPANGRWYAVEDSLARSSVAQAIRDCLHNNYRSSRQHKQTKRRQAKKHISGNSDLLSSILLTPYSLVRPITPDDFITTPPQVTTFTYCTTVSGNDVFSILASTFATCSSGEENPFEPVPIVEIKSAGIRPNEDNVLDSMESALELTIEPLVSTYDAEWDEWDEWDALVSFLEYV